MVKEFIVKSLIKHKEEGSMTVEAALVTPIVLYATTIFFYFFQLMNLQLNLQTALTQVGKEYTRNAYLTQHIVEDFVEEPNERLQWLIDYFKIGEQIQASIYKRKLKKYVDLSYINETMIVNGFDGLKIEAMQDYFDDGVVDLVLTYQYKMKALFFFPGEISCVQRVHMNNWIGKEVPLKLELQDEEPSKELEVYVSKTGKVYHWYENCSHIKLSVKKASFSSLDGKKNKNGSKYLPCSSCMEHPSKLENGSVYITDYGTNYHQNKKCSRIKRTVDTITFSQAEKEGRTLCSRCSKRKVKETEGEKPVKKDGKGQKQ